MEVPIIRIVAFGPLLRETTKSKRKGMMKCKLGECFSSHIRNCASEFFPEIAAPKVSNTYHRPGSW